MPDLTFVPQKEFSRLFSIECDGEKRTALFSTFCRINTLYMIARAGSGHIGTSFSSVDVVSWLFLNELSQISSRGSISSGDVYFSSKGHDVPSLYAVLIGLGRLEFDLIHSLRRLEGLPGHPDISTPFIETNTGSLGMGISKAKGMVVADRLRGKKRNIFVMTGDGELQEGQLWESLSSASNKNMSEITVIVDHNKIQSDTWVDSVSNLGDIETKFESFGWFVERCDGHNYSELSKTFQNTRSITDRPKIIIADTIKGNGVSFMESNAMAINQEFYRYHSGAPSSEDYTAALDEMILQANQQLEDLGERSLETKTKLQSKPTQVHGNQQNLIAAYSDTLLDAGRQNDNVIVFDADLILDCGLIPFRDEFPNRFVECGIAEQDMVSQAGAVALNGLLPIVHSFACFLGPRANEQIYNNASEHSKIIYVGSLAGIIPGGPGHSHQSVRDISALGAIPGLTLIEASCEREVSMAMKYALSENQGSTYLRLTSVSYDMKFKLPEDYELEVGHGVTISDGENALLISYGLVMLSEAYEASRILRDKCGFSLKVVNLPWLNRVDDSWLAKQLSGIDVVFTLDNHYIKGGQGEMIAARISEIDSNETVRLKRFGLTSIPKCGTNDEVLKFHRLDADSLAEDIYDFCTS